MQPSPSTPPNEPNPAERREAPRTRRQVKVQVADAEGKNPPVGAWVADCSLGGLCLTVHEEAQIGDIFRVRPASAGAEVPWVQVQVKSKRPVEKTWELRCQFVRTPSYSVVLMFS
jgi:hypothetical protein